MIFSFGLVKIQRNQELRRCGTCMSLLMEEDINGHADWHARSELSPTARTLADVFSEAKET